jgi:hypothetical protein
MISVDRARVMAYRIAELGLTERVDVRPAELAVLDLGIQQYTPDSAQVALTARSSADPFDDRLIAVWAARGAPHLQRRDDLDELVRQLWPLSDTDAAARIKSAQIPDAGSLGIRAFTVTAEAFREAITAPMPRGVASTEVSKRVPVELTYECRACQARHIAGNVWQQAGLAGGIEVLSRGKDAQLGPIGEGSADGGPGSGKRGGARPDGDRGGGAGPDSDGPGGAGPDGDERRVVGSAGGERPPLPESNVGIARVIGTYLRFLGPAGPAEVAKFLGSSTAEIRKVWPSDGLVEVRVDGRKAWLPESEIPALESASAVDGVRWIPGMDPLLQARDRDLLIPDREAQKAVWRPLGNPGALLVDGEVGGVWRARMSGRKRVDLTVSAFGALTASQRKRVEEEAMEVARARGVAEASVSYE